MRQLFQGTLPARTCWSGVPPFQERGEDVCAHSKLKTRSKNIELVRSGGRVTDTSSAETNLASHLSLTSCAWRLQQGVEASLCSSQSASRAASPLKQLCRIMVRYAPLVSQRPKPPQVLGRKRAASALSATTECLPASGDCRARDDVSGAVREEVRVRLSRARSNLSILQSPCVWQRFRTRY